MQMVDRVGQMIDVIKFDQQRMAEQLKQGRNPGCRSRRAVVGAPEITYTTAEQVAVHQGERPAATSGGVQFFDVKRLNGYEQNHHGRRRLGQLSHRGEAGAAKAGYTVMEAGDGKDALAKLAGAKVNLIVCDVNMPNMDGLTFLKTLKTLPGPQVCARDHADHGIPGGQEGRGQGGGRARLDHQALPALATGGRCQQALCLRA